MYYENRRTRKGCADQSGFLPGVHDIEDAGLGADHLVAPVHPVVEAGLGVVGGDVEAGGAGLGLPEGRRVGGEPLEEGTGDLLAGGVACVGGAGDAGAGGDVDIGVLQAIHVPERIVLEAAGVNGGTVHREDVEATDVEKREAEQGLHAR